MSFHRPHERPSGEIRRSQVVTTYGAGAMVDLTEKSVLVRGTDCWKYGQAEALAVIDEKRLYRVLSPRLRTLGIELDPRAPFRAPPTTTDDAPSRAEGIPVLEFPTWFVCQNPRCRALLKPPPHTLPRSGPFRHDGCDRNNDWECVPVRFVATCRSGHLEDFPWSDFVHAGKACGRPLTLREGATGELGEIVVACACGAQRALTDALVEQKNPWCKGQRPWLGRDGTEPDCQHRLRLLVRTATNTYFSHCESALAIPEPEAGPAGAAARAVESVLDMLDGATSLEDVATYRKNRKVAKALEGLSDDEVLRVLQQLLSGEPQRAVEGLRTAEFRQFIAQPLEQREVPPRGSDFFARRLAPARRAGLPPSIEHVVLAHKLREVRVQLGFTRSEPVSPDLEGEFSLGVQLARVGLHSTWLPASEIHGEGLFVALHESAVREWEARPAVQQREAELRDGHAASRQGNETQLAFPGVRFYLLHSLSHLLITAISLECGYGASAIRERLYCAEACAELPMAALLLSTGTPGSEGTLGGLVEQGSALLAHLRAAYDDASLCAGDPLCASHSPRHDHAERFLEGAACHGCLYIAEPSCERFNRYLDRALVVPTLGNPRELAFFGERP
jgi:hypothetical protein